MEWTDEWHQSENQNPTGILDPCVYPLLPWFIISNKSGMVNLNALGKIITQSILYRVFGPGQPRTVSLGPASHFFHSKKCYPFLKARPGHFFPCAFEGTVHFGHWATQPLHASVLVYVCSCTISEPN